MHSAPESLQKRIFVDLQSRHIPFDNLDKFGRNSLHYAAKNSFTFLIEEIVKAKPELVDKPDNKGHTAFTLIHKHSYNPKDLALFLINKGKANIH